jgi:hypothetical protein
MKLITLASQVGLLKCQKKVFAIFNANRNGALHFLRKITRSAEIRSKSAQDQNTI